jgi:xylitol oxidase
LEDALEAVYSLNDVLQPLMLSSEIRQIRQDNIPLSPGKGEDRVAVHFVWKPEPEKIMKGMRLLYKKWGKYNTKPHMGKYFCNTPEEIRKLYGEDLEDLKKLMVKHDPEGKLRNEWLDHYFFD